LVSSEAPITGEQIAETLSVSRPTLRSDLALLVMLGLIDAKPKVGYFPAKSQAADSAARQMLQQVKVGDVQARPVIVSETTSIGEAVVTLFLENVGSLIVADEKYVLQGIVSRKDLLKVTLGNANAQTMPIGLVMTRANIVTVTPEETAIEAARKMIHYEVDSLPVVVPLEGDESKLQVVGRVTKTTMTKLLLDYALGV